MLVPVSISYTIWVLGAVGTLLALGLSWKRGMLREFPVFSSYLAFHLIEIVTAFVILNRFGRSSWPYFYQYWIVQAIGLGLRFAVIYEIVSHVLRPYEGLWHAGRLLFRGGGVLLVAAGIGVAVAGPSSEPIWAIRGALVMQRSIDVVQCGLLALLFLFAAYFALTWRNYVFGIALGFGVIATLELLASAVAAQTSPSISGVLLNSLPRVAYDFAVIIWVAYLLSPEPSRAELKALPQHELERWNQELLELLQR